MRLLATVLGFFLIATGTVFAHSPEGAAGGLVSGFLHPILGLDHVVAMVAVGLWGAFLGRPAIWILPVVFPMIMALGGIQGIWGVSIPSVEVVIAASGLVLGVLVATKCILPLWIATAVVGFFAIFHGYAHGLEMPEATSALTYAIGFVVGTGLLHLAGIAIGLLNNVPKGEWVIRSAGVIIALIGAYYLLGALGII